MSKYKSGQWVREKYGKRPMQIMNTYASDDPTCRFALREKIGAAAQYYGESDFEPWLPRSGERIGFRRKGERAWTGGTYDGYDNDGHRVFTGFVRMSLHFETEFEPAFDEAEKAKITDGLTLKPGDITFTPMGGESVKFPESGFSIGSLMKPPNTEQLSALIAKELNAAFGEHFAGVTAKHSGNAIEIVPAKKVDTSFTMTVGYAAPPAVPNPAGYNGTIRTRAELREARMAEAKAQMRGEKR